MPHLYKVSFRKRNMYLVALLQKETCNLRHSIFSGSSAEETCNLSDVLCIHAALFCGDSCGARILHISLHVSFLKRELYSVALVQKQACNLYASLPPCIAATLASLVAHVEAAPDAVSPFRR